MTADVSMRIKVLNANKKNIIEKIFTIFFINKRPEKRYLV